MQEMNTGHRAWEDKGEQRTTQRWGGADLTAASGFPLFNVAIHPSPKRVDWLRRLPHPWAVTACCIFLFSICHKMCPLHHPNNTADALAPHSFYLWRCHRRGTASSVRNAFIVRYTCYCIFVFGCIGLFVSGTVLHEKYTEWVFLSKGWADLR